LCEGPLVQMQNSKMIFQIENTYFLAMILRSYSNQQLKKLPMFIKHV